MTTHDKDKIIAAAKEACCELRETQDGLVAYLGHTRISDVIERLYAIAFDDGRQAEREEIVKDLLPPIATPQTKAHYIANEIADALCKAIRARSTK